MKKIKTQKGWYPFQCVCGQWVEHYHHTKMHRTCTLLYPSSSSSFTLAPPDLSPLCLSSSSSSPSPAPSFLSPSLSPPQSLPSCLSPVACLPLVLLPPSSHLFFFLVSPSPRYCSCPHPHPQQVDPLGCHQVQPGRHVTGVAITTAGFICAVPTTKHTPISTGSTTRAAIIPDKFVGLVQPGGHNWWDEGRPNRGHRQGN